VGEHVLAERNLGAIEGGGRRVLEAVHDVLVAASRELDAIDRIIVGVGPGGFTGIRIGIATALGLGHAVGIPVVGVSSLEALALGIARARPDATMVAPAIDARRKEVFGAIYRVGDRFEEHLAPHASAPQDLVATISTLESEVVVGGNGVGAYDDAFTALGRAALPADSEGNYPKAIDLIHRADDGGAGPARPVYCRLPDAEEKRRVREAAS
jgi:tRNA threonylcarbamoyladenosine biosynthesis protein TsaB